MAWSVKAKNTFFTVVNTLFLIEGILGLAIAIYLIAIIASATGNATLTVLVIWPIFGAIKIIVLASIGYWAAAKQKILVLKVYGWLMVLFVVINAAVFIYGLTVQKETNEKYNTHADSNDSGNTVVLTSVLSVIDILILIFCAVASFLLAYALHEDKFGPRQYGKV